MTGEDQRLAFEALIASQGIDSLSNEIAFNQIGRLIDLAGDLKRDDGTGLAIKWCDMLEERGLSNPEAALLEYFRANAWSNRQHDRHHNAAAAWAWEQPELRKSILYLRKAVNHLGFSKLTPLRRCQILTNLANQMNTIGRFAEALEYWDRALVINQHFGMALGNRGCGLARYARTLYDDGQAKVFLRFAHEILSASLSTQAYYESPGNEKAKAFFNKTKTGIERAVTASRGIDVDGHNMGASDKERQYRRWCLQNRLFLNPLNDLGAYSIANRDVLMLPNFVTLIGESPTLIGFFNQMKQEFVSARWLYYEGVHAQHAHFSDRDVRLSNTLDYRSSDTRSF